jgi:hypothetical protein
VDSAGEVAVEAEALLDFADRVIALCHFHLPSLPVLITSGRETIARRSVHVKRKRTLQRANFATRQ